MSAHRKIHLYVGHTYAVGSLMYRARTITALPNKGRTVVYRAEDEPLTTSGQGRTEGKTYECKREVFLRWLHRVLQEQAEVGS